MQNNPYGGAPMLSGMMNVGQSMFSNFAASFQPTPDEMEAEAIAAQFNRVVKLKNVKVETYDLKRVEDAKDYAKRLEMLFHGIQAKTHMILFNDRRFVEQPAPRWVAHIEWAEFELIEKHNPTVKGHIHEEERDKG